MPTLNRLRSGALAGARRLDLCDAGLSALPPEVFGLADSLEILNLSGNQLRQLPPELPRLHRLKVIFCSDNPFTELPEVLGECQQLQMVGFKACQIKQVPAVALPPALRWLTLTDNAITQLPGALGERPALQKLMLAGNRLTALPDTLAQAERLELIRLAANQLTQLPEWLTALPRLAWLALAGNPLGWALPDMSAVPAVPWAQLQLDGLLGEGASGHIYRAHRQGYEDSLALKLFKGAVTSDGLPAHELSACLAAGQHPSLCTPSATLVGHPQGTPGLLLPLIPSSWVNLAGPPSLESCTRDIYPEPFQITLPVLLRLATALAGALAHLHRRGVMHGDLYAHNILWRPDVGEAMLGDFGAATLLPTAQPELSAALQALDVRAFGCLLEELLASVWPEPTHPTVAAALHQLVLACLQPRPGERPTMQAVAAQLRHLAA